MVVESILIREIAVNRMARLRLIDQFLKCIWSVRDRRIPKDHNKVDDHMTKLTDHNLNSLHGSTQL